MKQTIRLFAATDVVVDPVEFQQRRDRLFQILTDHFGSRASIGDGWIEISMATPEDFGSIQSASRNAGIGHQCVVEYNYSASEYKRARFVALAVEGEPVDLHSDGIPLNTYPESLCPTCLMPNEDVLPNPYEVSLRLLDSQENYWGEGPGALDREIYAGLCGVVIVNNRVKKILERVADTSCVSVPVTCRGAGKSELWAVRPLVKWGVQSGSNVSRRCPTCDRPTKVRLRHDDDDCSAATRYSVESQKIPDSDIVCAEEWFGDREASPYGFVRDVFISGRMYSLLMDMAVRGLCPPSEVIWVGDEVPMIALKEASDWVRHWSG